MRGMNREKKARSSGNKWSWFALFWVAMGLIDGTNTVVLMRSQGMHHAWPELFASIAARWTLWAFVTPAIFWMWQKYPLRWQKEFAGNWLRHVAAFLAVGAVGAAWTAIIEIWLNPWEPQKAPDPFTVMWPRLFFGQMLSVLLLYSAMVVVRWLLESRERIARQEMEAARLAEQLSKAQLSALRQQIEPHFLFNTLNTVAALVREGKSGAAVDVIAGLSELLRHALKTSERQQVALGEELEILEKYLEIEKVRFAERLTVHMEVPNELREARVPSLILQPIVENAVKHGISRRAAGGVIKIGAERRNGSVRLSVFNDGPGFPKEWERGGGIGLGNVRERLASLYGGNGELRVENEAGGVKVTVTVPVENEGE